MSAHAGSPARTSVRVAPSCGVVTMSANGRGHRCRLEHGAPRRRAGRPRRSCRGGEMLHLGADVELHGSIPTEKLAAAARLVGSYADAARAAGADELAVLITSPGRQAENGNELLDAISGGGRLPHPHPQRGRGGSARVRGRARGRRAPGPPSRRGRRRRRRLGAGRRRHPARRPGVAALDRPRFAAADQQAARRRPARARGDRRRPRRGGALPATGSIRPSRGSRSPSAAARVR